MDETANKWPKIGNNGTQEKNKKKGLERQKVSNFIFDNANINNIFTYRNSHTAGSQERPPSTHLT